MRLTFFQVVVSIVLMGALFNITLIEAAPQASSIRGSGQKYGDFNGDGYDDLAIGVPYEDVGTIQDAGVVQVLYGSPRGLRASRPDDQRWHQNSPGIKDVCEANDRFGYALAVGDFDNDGYGDLAIGVPGEDVGTIVDAGCVNVLYGSSGGLTAAGDQRWHQNSPSVKEVSAWGDLFGYALAVGDFDYDGYDDLAIGVPQEYVGWTIQWAGCVNVLYGSSGGLQASSPDDQLWHQNKPGVNGYCENAEYFGYDLAVGDFDYDGYDDLAIGVPGDRKGGCVNVLYGSTVAGLTAARDQRWHQNSPGVKGVSEWGDRFGHSLAVGDFNNDGYDDLAIGVVWKQIGIHSNAGCVNVLYGFPRGGLSASGNQRWHQNKPGVRGECSENDQFGHALAVGDFNNDGYDDLAIGVPADVVIWDGAGCVNVLYGSSGGLQASSPDDQRWHQNSPGVKGKVTGGGGWFGHSLAVGDFNNDGSDDLAIGVKSENVGTIANAGCVNVLYGSSGGLQASSPDDQRWHQNSPGVKDVCENFDMFGFV